MNQTALPKGAPEKHLDFSLVEVLIALVVLSIGLIGMAGIQQAGVRNNHNALLHSQASMLAYEITDMMRSNQPSLEFGRYNSIQAPTTTIPACLKTGTSPAIQCNSAEMTLYHLATWYDHLNEQLPQGTGTISCIDSDTTDAPGCSTGSTFLIDVSWVETDIGGAEQMTFRTEVQL